MSSSGWRPRRWPLVRWVLARTAEVKARMGWDRDPCSWCKEEMRWSLEPGTYTVRVGRPVHAECLTLAEAEEVRQSWQ